MKNFDFQISTEISVLSLPEPILIIFGMTSVCVCVFVRMFVSRITQKTIGRRILKFWI
ncbi:hypothetical protein O3M35_006807 [Rhynocoris fuscipes]|uniref:ATP synthase F0 subunit 8 n=1 Tax=Rhynocoris fuscipes TaxID=488301 RepID=A0AAW1DKR0_9HEMI